MIKQNKIKKIISNILPAPALKLLIYVYALYISNRKGLHIENNKSFYDIKDKKNKCIRISHKHCLYLIDIVTSFQYYWNAVSPVRTNGIFLVDYSTPKYHQVYGYNLHPIIFPSFAEPVLTTNQYLKFARIKNGSVVLDLGAYSGLTSIIFDQLVGFSGRVIAVDADIVNIQYIKMNLDLYEKITRRKVALLEGAVWGDNNGIMFSNEGNMGSSSTSLIGSQRGDVRKINSFTLGTIAKMFQLKTIDFIKCDIEGAESVIFNDDTFFKRYHPRIIIEAHIINSKSTLQACIDQLSKYGYKFKKIKQHRISLPLLACFPA